MKKTIFLLLIVFVSCTKQDVLPVEQTEEIVMKSNFNNGRKPIVDDFGHTLKLTQRKTTMALLAASANAGKGKGWGKGGNPNKPPKDGGEEPPPPPPATGANVILLDFDGHTITNPNSWWTNLTINGVKFDGVTAYSGLTETEINIVGEKFAKAYAPYDVIITTDEAVFNTYEVTRRTRVVFTTTSFFGAAGGVAWLNSREYGLDDPVYVFPNWLSYNGKYAGGAGVHEAGHALGLHHQADFIGGIYRNEYSRGFTSDRAPYMGVDYYDPNDGEFFSSQMINGTWTIWSRICDCHVNEVAFLSDPLKLGVK